MVADVECDREYEFERRRFGSNPEQLKLLSEWLIEQQVEEVVATVRREAAPDPYKEDWNALSTSYLRDGHQES